MEIKKEQNGGTVVIALAGRLDTNASPEVIAAFNETLVEGVEEFVLDMADCPYVASSGLRAIISAQKTMNTLGGSMVVKNVSGDVMEVFEMTGFSDILTFA